LLCDVVGDSHSRTAGAKDEEKPANAAAAAADNAKVEADLEIALPRGHAALRAPEGFMSLFKTLQECLLRLEYHLWGVLDGGWAGAAAASGCLPACCSILCPCPATLHNLHTVYNVAWLWRQRF
jgi:hypothetical protein